MDKKYTRPGAETVKECGECGTVWKDSFLEPHEPKNVCYMCGKKWNPDVKIQLPKLQNRYEDGSSIEKNLRKLFHLQSIVCQNTAPERNIDLIGMITEIEHRLHKF